MPCGACSRRAGASPGAPTPTISRRTDDVDLCVAAGYTFYTIDPGDHVDNEAHTASLEVLKDKIHALPWDDWRTRRRHCTSATWTAALRWRTWSWNSTETTLARAAAKYGRAVAHTVRMYRHLAARHGRAGL